MNSIHHKLVAGAVLAGAIVTVGCSAEMFTQANDTLKTIQTAGKTVGNVRIPTAAIAASMGGIEIMNALVKDGQDANAKGLIAAGGGNIIAAGGGNIIAAGGGNIIAAGSGNYLLTEFDPGTNKTETINQNGVKGNVTYTSNIEADTKLLRSDFKATDLETQGYVMNVDGSFWFAGAVAQTSTSEKADGEVVIKLTGSIKPKNDGLALTIKGLSLHVPAPMPSSMPKIGAFQLEAEDKEKKEKHELSVDLGIANSQITAEGTLKINGVEQKDRVKFDQSNPGGAGSDAPPAEKK